MMRLHVFSVYFPLMETLVSDGRRRMMMLNICVLILLVRESECSWVDARALDIAPQS